MDCKKEKIVGENNILILIDVVGVLCDVRRENEKSTVAEDARVGQFYVYDRPGMKEVVEVLSRHYTIGVWSTLAQATVKELTYHVFGNIPLHAIWDARMCMPTMADEDWRLAHSAPTNLKKPLLLKSLGPHTDDPTIAPFIPEKILIIDSTTYRTVNNLPGLSLTTTAFDVDLRDKDEEMQHLKGYLKRMRSNSTCTQFLLDSPYQVWKNISRDFSNMTDAGAFSNIITWCLANRQYRQPIVHIWEKELLRADTNHKQLMMNLANDIIKADRTSATPSQEYALAFWPVFPRALRHSIKHSLKGSEGGQTKKRILQAFEATFEVRKYLLPEIPRETSLAPLWRAVEEAAMRNSQLPLPEAFTTQLLSQPVNTNASTSANSDSSPEPPPLVSPDSHKPPRDSEISHSSHTDLSDPSDLSGLIKKGTGLVDSESKRCAYTPPTPSESDTHTSEIHNNRHLYRITNQKRNNCNRHERKEVRDGKLVENSTRQDRETGESSSSIKERERGERRERVHMGEKEEPRSRHERRPLRDRSQDNNNNNTDRDRDRDTVKKEKEKVRGGSEMKRERRDWDRHRDSVCGRMTEGARRDEERERERDLKRNKDRERVREREREHDVVREREKERQQEREIERERAKKHEREKEILREKNRERQRLRRRELEWEREMERERKRERRLADRLSRTKQNDLDLNRKHSQSSSVSISRTKTCLEEMRLTSKETQRERERQSDGEDRDSRESKQKYGEGASVHGKDKDKENGRSVQGVECSESVSPMVVNADQDKSDIEKKEIERDRKLAQEWALQRAKQWDGLRDRERGERGKDCNRDRDSEKIGRRGRKSERKGEREKVGSGDNERGRTYDEKKRKDRECSGGGKEDCCIDNSEKNEGLECEDDREKPDENNGNDDGEKENRTDVILHKDVNISCSKNIDKGIDNGC